MVEKVTVARVVSKILQRFPPRKLPADDLGRPEQLVIKQPPPAVRRAWWNRRVDLSLDLSSCTGASKWMMIGVRVQAV